MRRVLVNGAAPVGAALVILGWGLVPWFTVAGVVLVVGAAIGWATGKAGKR